MKIKSLLIIALCLGFFSTNAQYISEIIDFKPAPGQYVNKSPGLPASAETIVGNANGLVSLGAFGGYVIFKFENPVQNHPDNPYGIDFTIFGNPLPTWAEPGIVSVMKDENGNGLPDDTWYELAGSDYFFSSTKYNYEVTYVNPNDAVDIPWTDNYGGSGSVLTTSFHKQPYYPHSDNYSNVDQEQYTLSGTVIEGGVDTSAPAMVTSTVRAFGYADNKPGKTEPHTVPDNPYTTAKEGTGGDAFDISWAVDADGNYVDLDVIHFVKVHTGMQGNGGWLGEVSTEVSGAAVVEPDASITGEMDIIVIKQIPSKIVGDKYQLEAYAFHAGRVQKTRKIVWSTDIDDVEVDSDKILNFTTSGKVNITAALEDRPEITATVTTTLEYEPEISTAIGNSINKSISLYPNPANNIIYLSGVENETVEIYNIFGQSVKTVNNYNSNTEINISDLSKGVYLIKIDNSQSLRFIKK